jgi:hypothetical protein
MPLQRIKGEIVRENYGFAFPMRIVGSSRTLRVVVADDALIIENRTAADEELQADFENHISSFESLACEKYDLGHVTADGVVFISAGDLVSLLA